MTDPAPRLAMPWLVKGDLDGFCGQAEQAYPEARPALQRLRGAGVRLAILSNGAPRMLAAAAESAGLAPLLDAVSSVEEVGIYKPSPAVYRLAPDRLGLWPSEIASVSDDGNRQGTPLIRVRDLATPRRTGGARFARGPPSGVPRPLGDGGAHPLLEWRCPGPSSGGRGGWRLSWRTRRSRGCSRRSPISWSSRAATLSRCAPTAGLRR